MYTWLKTLTKKEVSRVFRIWKQTLVPPVMTSILYFLIFGSFVGSRIGEIGEVSYMEFIVPGFIMMSVITASYTNVASSFFGSKFQRSIEELLVSPMPKWQIIIGYMLGGMVRGILVWIIIYAVSYFFVPIQIHSYLQTLLFVLFTSAFFSLAGMFNGFFAKSFDDVSLIPTFVITPMVYLGWVFYSLEFLSPFWQGVSKFNPIFYMVNGLRNGMIGISELPIYSSLMVLIIFTGIFFFLNLKLFNKWYGMKS